MAFSIDPQRRFEELLAKMQQNSIAFGNRFNANLDMLAPPGRDVGAFGLGRNQAREQARAMTNAQLEGLPFAAFQQVPPTTPPAQTGVPGLAAPLPQFSPSPPPSPNVGGAEIFPGPPSPPPPIPFRSGQELPLVPSESVHAPIPSEISIQNALAQSPAPDTGTPAAPSTPEEFQRFIVDRMTKSDERGVEAQEFANKLALGGLGLGGAGLLASLFSPDRLPAPNVQSTRLGFGTPGTPTATSAQNALADLAIQRRRLFG